MKRRGYRIVHEFIAYHAAGLPIMVWPLWVFYGIYLPFRHFISVTIIAITFRMMCSWLYTGALKI